LPIRPFGQDFGGAATLVIAVIPFGEIGIDFGGRTKAGEFASPHRALRRAGQDLGKNHSVQPRRERPRLALAILGQGQIGAAGVLTREAPGGFAVPPEIE